jgi:hypothetical protein
VQHTAAKYVMLRCPHMSCLSPDVPPIMNADPAKLTILSKQLDPVRWHNDHVRMSRVSGSSLPTVWARTAMIRDGYRIPYASCSTVCDDAAADLTSGACVVSCTGVRL